MQKPELGNTSGAIPASGKHYTVTPTSAHSIQMSNGWCLERVLEGQGRDKRVTPFPAWDLRPGPSLVFNDTLTLSGVVLRGGHGNLWIEGRIRILGGSALEIRGGGWVWNGIVEVSQSAGTVAKDNAGNVVAVVPFDGQPTAKVLLHGRQGPALVFAAEGT